jgi:hypothetical protein
MPRKSQELRTQQTLDLIAAYDGAGILDSYQGRFIQDIAARMARGRYPTKRQRDWLDSLIDAGVPEPKGDPVLLARINEARELWAGNTNRAYQLRVVNDFCGRVRDGKDLSEKQSAYLESLLAKADKDKAGVKWVPTDEQKENLEAATKLYAGYAAMWRSDRPALRTAVQRVKDWLVTPEQVEIEEYHYNKLMKSMAGRIKKLKNPRFQQGDMAYFHKSVFGEPAEKMIVTCVSDTYVSDKGKIANDWLYDGEVVAIDQERIAKR